MLMPLSMRQPSCTESGHLCFEAVQADTPVAPLTMRTLLTSMLDRFILDANMAPHSSWPRAPTCKTADCLPQHTAAQACKVVNLEAHGCAKAHST